MACLLFLILGLAVGWLISAAFVAVHCRVGKSGWESEGRIRELMEQRHRLQDEVSRRRRSLPLAGTYHKQLDRNRMIIEDLRSRLPIRPQGLTDD